MIFTSDQLDAMRAAQNSHMNDTIDITTRVPYYQNGETLYSGVVQSGVACGFNFTEGIEVDRGQVIVVDYDATVRLPLGTSIDINDTVTLRTLAGQVHTEVFEVFEYPKFGTTAMIVDLKRRGS